MSTKLCLDCGRIAMYLDDRCWRCTTNSYRMPVLGLSDHRILKIPVKKEKVQKSEEAEVLKPFDIFRRK